MERESSWERTVVMRLGAGDASALAEVYDQFSGFVYGLARRITHDTAFAEDVTQEVFCQLWERPSSFRPDRGSLRTFLAVLAHRRAVDCVRREQRRRDRDSAACEPAGSQPDIAEEVETYLAAGALRSALEALPTDQRRSVMLTYFEGYTFRQVATLLGIPEGTAKSRVRLALERLVVAMKPEGTLTS